MSIWLGFREVLICNYVHTDREVKAQQDEMVAHRLDGGRKQNTVTYIVMAQHDSFGLACCS